MKSVIKEIGSIFIPVKNLEESITWYESILGFKLTVNWGLGATLKLHSNSTVLGLVQVEEEQPVKFKNKENSNTSYYNFLTDDIHYAYDFLKQNDVKVYEINDLGEFYLLDFEDLDGNLLSMIDLRQDSRWIQNFNS